MTDQLTLNLDVRAPDPRVHGQLTVLPGTAWEHIFDMPAPGDASDAPASRSNSQEEAA